MFLLYLISSHPDQHFLILAASSMRFGYLEYRQRCTIISIVNVYIEGILPKGPYLPCVSMAGRALLAGYHRYVTMQFEVCIFVILNCILAENKLTTTTIIITTTTVTDTVTAVAAAAATVTASVTVTVTPTTTSATTTTTTSTTATATTSVGYSLVFEITAKLWKFFSEHFK